jgi:molybdopterin-guanine dinucleotide biosynthesis adapter protein
MLHQQPAVLSIVGYSNSGKTTLITRLIERICQRGWKVGTIKHHGKTMEWDQPGKDTWRHRQAGADIVTITASNQTVVCFPRTLEVEELLPLYSACDLVLVEGFKQADWPKWVILRRGEDLSLLRELHDIQAVVSWFPIDDCPYPLYAIDDVDGMEAALIRWLNEEK